MTRRDGRTPRRHPQQVAALSRETHRRPDADASTGCHRTPGSIETATSASFFLPLWDRSAEWRRRLAMIRGAASFLYLSTFYVEYDRYGIELIDALADAQRRGVAVNLLIDGFGQRLGGVLMSRENKAALASRLHALASAGAVVSLYRPGRRLQRLLGGGQHVKIQISEAGEAIFGSSNVTRASFEGWNEFAVALRGRVAADLLESYPDLGGTVVGSHVEQLRELARPGSDDLPLDYWLCNPNLLQGRSGPVGWRGRNVVSDRLVGMIDAARHSIRITSFYFKPIDELIAALVRARRRGVHIEIHHSHLDALPATELAWIAAAAHYRRLLGEGVRVFENRHGEHSKIILVDDERTAFGTYNFEEAAHDRLAEAMLHSRDRRAVTAAATIFEQLHQQQDSLPVTAGTLAALPARLKMKRALLGRFKRWM
jgi:cardiolipin synthase